MNRRTVVFAPSLLLLALVAAPSFAADDEALRKDLTVVEVTVQAESDFAGTCKDANKYRVYLNDAGRVVIDKRK
jgi:hypothetical protein